MMISPEAFEHVRLALRCKVLALQERGRQTEGMVEIKAIVRKIDECRETNNLLNEILAEHSLPVTDLFPEDKPAPPVDSTFVSETE